MRTEWFVNPKLSGPTPFTIQATGQVYGHLCLWQSCHLSYQAECVQPPHHFRGDGRSCTVCGRGEENPNHSQAKYRYFTLGEQVTEQGMHVDVGQVTFRTGHAPLKVGAKTATAHYDETGTAAADVRVGEDEYGCWLAGAVRSLSDDAIREFQGAKLSGDWRQIRGRLELVGILSVNVPGFPVPRARVAAAPHPHALALVAGAMPVDVSAVSLHDKMRHLRAESGVGMDALKRRLTA
jgi:hypothetical protein